LGHRCSQVRVATRRRETPARHDIQRETLFELQDELKNLVQTTSRIMLEGRQNFRDHGELRPISDELNTASADAFASVQRLRSRILDDHLREAIGEFTAFCADDTAFGRAERTPEQVAAMMTDLNARMLALSTRYSELIDRCGELIRKEIDRL
jgi:hypothetical protein